MSQNENKALAKASDEREGVSVYDFLYCDERRVGAFLSQFDELGVPTRVSVSETVQKARSRAMKFSAGGGVSGLGNANLTLERGPAAAGGQKGEQRDYNPYWANALALLDYLDTNDLVCREVKAARIGQFVLVTGSLAVFDMAMLQTSWGNNHIKAIVRRALATTAESPPSDREIDDKVKEFEGTFDLLQVCPHAILSTIQTSDQSVWSSLHADGLMVAAGDLIIKHGVHIPGQWSAIGIVDAFPDGEEPNQSMQQRQTAAATSLGALTSFIGGIAPSIRNFVGRPRNAYGMTPLMIFREVSS